MEGTFGISYGRVKCPNTNDIIRLTETVGQTTAPSHVWCSNEGGAHNPDHSLSLEKPRLGTCSTAWTSHTARKETSPFPRSRLSIFFSLRHLFLHLCVPFHILVMPLLPSVMPLSSLSLPTWWLSFPLIVALLSGYFPSNRTCATLAFR